MDPQPINQEDIENAKKEAEQEISQVGELPQTDLPPIPDKEKLDQLKAFIDALPAEKRAQLLANLASSNGNVLNPNNKTYSTESSDSMLKQKLRRKMQEKKYGRMTSHAKEQEKQKMLTKMQEYQKQKGPTQSPQTTEQSTTETCGDNCDNNCGGTH
ncbi:hypothetical protein Indivirus_2_32 [Indivirus ILV1]|uniref:Uncharacterized protein n=1 Tax=Indivirus ILV1 TaxID=1977633 RepID=A0A1V0SD57_9VIRU|nr:hypothetical protein Indivirus_2_32 [Indivirus ILV1]